MIKKRENMNKDIIILSVSNLKNTETKKLWNDYRV